MLWLIFNQLKAKAEEQLAEEQVGFKPGRSTVKQIFNSRVIIGAPTTPARSIPQIRRLKDGVWQSLAWPVAGPQKL